MAHYYTREGVLVAEVPMTTKAGMRATNISDARKLGLVPSVTTILRMIDKPMLNDWRVEQGVIAALQYRGVEVEDLDSLVKSITRESEEYSWRSADFGTQVHAGIAAGLTGEIGFVAPLPVMQVVNRFMTDVFPNLGFEVSGSEVSFVDQVNGVAGTADIVGKYRGYGAVLDIKTQDFTDPSKARYYDEHPLQLAGYDIGLGGPGRQRCSLIVSRSVPGLVAPIKVWAENERWDAAWLNLVNLWKLVNNWEG